MVKVCAIIGPALVGENEGMGAFVKEFDSCVAVASRIRRRGTMVDNGVAEGTIDWQVKTE